MDAMQELAQQEHPFEACGILLGEGGWIRELRETANVHPEPLAHFEIDPQVLIDAHRASRNGGLQIVGYFHSHPKGSAMPSEMDQKMAPGDGRIWAITNGAEFTFSCDKTTGFQQLSYVISDE